MERKGWGGPAENPVNGQVGGETIQESLLLRSWNCPGCSRVTVLVIYCLNNSVQQQTTKSHWHKHLIFPQASELRWLCFKLQMCCGGSALWSHSEAHTEEATATQGSSHGDGKGTRGQAHQHEHTADLCFHRVHQQPTGL